MFFKVTWPAVNINTTTPEDAVVVENCEFTGLCQTISPGGRTATLEETTEAGTEMTELDTTTDGAELDTTTDVTTTEMENIPTPARIFL
jgi:hypothetical protein